MAKAVAKAVAKAAAKAAAEAVAGAIVAKAVVAEAAAAVAAAAVAAVAVAAVAAAAVAVAAVAAAGVGVAAAAVATATLKWLKLRSLRESSFSGATVSAPIPGSPKQTKKESATVCSLGTSRRPGPPGPPPVGAEILNLLKLINKLKWAGFVFALGNFPKGTVPLGIGGVFPKGRWSLYGLLGERSLRERSLRGVCS